MSNTLRGANGQYTTNPPRVEVICSVLKCTNVSKCRELCQTHYARFRRHGDTNLRPKNSWLKKPKLKKNCLNCGVAFETHRSLDKAKYCSISCSKIGKPSSRKGTRLSADKIGPNHWNWKGGGSTLERVRFRDQLQQLIFQRDNFTCQICFQYSGYLQIDHIKKWSDYPELRFDMDNCRTLCMACHYYVTFKRKMPKGIVWGHNLSKRVA